MKNVFTVMLFVFVNVAFAQSDSTSTKKPSWKFEKERLRVGGGIGGGVTNNGTSINISPMVVYQFTDKFFAGPRLIYNYFSWGGFSYSNYGYGVLGRYFFKPTFFAQTEYQDIWYDIGLINSPRIRVPSFLVGAGYYNRPFTFTAMYDLFWQPNRGPYNSPLRVNFGLMF